MDFSNTRQSLSAYLMRGTSLAILVAAMSGGMVGGALAQAAAAPNTTASDATSGGELETVVVTAQRVVQDLQKVPVSVTVLSGDALHARGVIDAIDLQGHLPGVELQPIGVLFANIRGVGTFNLQPGVDSAVAYMIDGNYVAQSAALPPLLFDLDRVEALRGPQGTLFGRNSNAGAINLVTAAPTNTFQAMGSLTVGNYGLIASEGMVNVPLSDNFMARASFASEDHDPYLKDGHNDASTRAGRVRLLATPTSSLSILATVDYSYQDSNNNGASPCPPGSGGPCVGKPWHPFDGNASPLGTASLNPTPDFSHTSNLGAYAQVDWSLGWANLTYIPSYRTVGYNSLATPSYPSFGIDEHDKQHTEELRLSSPASSPFTWVAGLYYSREQLREHEYFVFPAAFGIPGVDGVANFFNLDPYSNTSKAVFAQATYPITDWFRATGGLRYTDEDKTAAGTANAYGGTQANPILVSSPTGAHEAHSGVTWKAGLEADVTPTSLLYATVSTGFKSGGTNQVTPGIGLPGTYGPETITAYELGSKNRFLDDRLQVNAEIFHYDYHGFQTLQADFEPSGLLFFVTVNSQRAEFNGGELEATYLLTDRDEVDVSATVLDARYTKFIVGGLNLSGYRATNAPTYTATFGYQHVFSLGDAGALTARAETRLVGPQWVNSDHAAGTLQGAYEQTTASLAYQPADSIWGLQVWGRNLENNGIVYDVNDSPAPAMGFVQPPRTFGVTLKVKTN